MLVWDWDKAVRCTEHGWLTDEPLEHHDAGIVAIRHLRDAHGMSAEAAEKATRKVQAHKDSEG
jgi:hypothetical protein